MVSLMHSQPGKPWKKESCPEKQFFSAGLYDSIAVKHLAALAQG